MESHHAFVRTSIVRRARLVASTLAIVLLVACSRGSNNDTEGWRTLLNGADLSGWDVVGDANWRVEEKAARADKSSAASFLVSKNRFANFDLELEFWVDPESPYYKPVFTEGKTYILYCQSDWRGVLAAATLKEMGLPNVYHLSGGFREWRNAGAPTAERARRLLLAALRLRGVLFRGERGRVYRETAGWLASGSASELLDG